MKMSTLMKELIVAIDNYIAFCQVKPDRDEDSTNLWIERSLELRRIIDDKWEQVKQEIDAGPDDELHWFDTNRDEIEDTWSGNYDFLYCF